MTQNSPATRGRRTSRRVSGGYLVIEVAVALLLVGLLIGVLGTAGVAYARAGDYYAARHQAQLAAESGLEYLRLGREPPRGDDVAYEVQRQAGEGQWQGLTRVTITATVPTRHHRPVQFTLRTYLQEPSP